MNDVTKPARRPPGRPTSVDYASMSPKEAFLYKIAHINAKMAARANPEKMRMPESLLISLLLEAAAVGIILKGGKAGREDALQEVIQTLSVPDVDPKEAKKNMDWGGL